MSTAGKLNIVMQLYENGLLCTCEHWESKMTEDNEGNEYLKAKVIHDKDCKAKDKVIELLNG